MKCRIVGNRSKVGPVSRLGRWLGLAVVSAATLSLATPAEAAGNYSARFVNEPYRALPLDGGTAVNVNSSAGTDATFAVSLPFPVSFYGQSFSSMHMSPDGWLSFTGSGSKYAAKHIPSTDAHDNMIAVWWRDHGCPANGMKTQTLGTAPNRTFIAEWNCHRISAAAATVNYQVWFREGSTTFEARYGTIGAHDDWKASIGIQKNSTLGVAAVACNTACTVADFPTGKKLVYSMGPDLGVVGLDVDSVIYAGVDIPVSATVANLGGELAANAEVQFWFGTGPQPAAGELNLGRADLVTDLEGGEEAVFSTVVTIPRDLEPGTYFLRAEVDPDGLVIDDDSRSNNVFSVEVVLGPPTTDLSVESVVNPIDGIIVGERQTIEWSLRNLGNLRADEIGYQVVVSDNEIISSTDRVIGTGVVTIGELTSVDVRSEIQIPADLRTGLFYLAIIVDPAGFLHEISKDNNVGVTAEPVWIRSTTGTILTSDVLEAESSSTWSVALEATGGDGFFEWTVESGQLPPGLSLSVMRDQHGRPLHTIIQGVPTATGTWSFVLRARSADWTDVKAFEIVVHKPGSIVVNITGNLPSGSFGMAYEGQLLAAGGSAPYTWSLASGSLPPGLSLSTSGRVFGSPLKDGTFTFEARVVDVAGREAVGPVQVVIAPPGQLTCVTDKLPTGRVGVEFPSTMVIAAGGVAPHTFTTEQARRLSNGTSDPGQPFPPGNAPPGLVLGQDGMVTGTPTAAGRYVWMVRITDARRIGAMCVITFDVTYDQGPAILTTSLEDGFVDTPYMAQLRQFGADETANWQLASGSRLPEGLVLSGDGRITGMPSLSALEGAGVRVFPFVVRVKDSANREAIESLSIRIWREPPRDPPPPPAEETGCQAGGGELSLLAIAGAAAHVFRRRKSS